MDQETIQMSCNFNDTVSKTDNAIYVQVMQLLQAQPMRTCSYTHVVLLLTSVPLASVNNVRKCAFMYTETGQGLCNPKDVYLVLNTA